jgi:tetratricopeptide (TPR) repeat protein
MNSVSRWTAFLLLGLSTACFGQKIKYKDLFVLLNAQQFDEAEPFLKKYLRVNDDNPNAYLFMGMIYKDKSLKTDVLRDTEKRIMFLDSAVYFFGLAYKGVTEKEIDRNEEYYQMFNRRDTRTGKFGVKLSDVKLKLEEYMALKEKVKQIQLIKSQFLASQHFYERAQILFQQFQSTYPGSRELFLRANESVVAQLIRLANVADSCHMNFNDYKASVAAYGNIGHNQDLDPLEIIDYKKQGTTPSDFYSDDLKVWDYKRWALATVEIVEKEVIPAKEQLITFDAELNREQQRIRKDSVSVMSNLGVLRSKLSMAVLRRLDPDPMPIRVFTLKLAELEYGSQVVEDRVLRDTAALATQVAALDKEYKLAHLTDSLATLLDTDQLTKDADNYSQYVSASYGTVEAFRTYVSSTREFASHAAARKKDVLSRKRGLMKWLIHGSDSIPLDPDVATSGRYKPLIIKQKVTIGLVYADSIPSGYAYLIPPSHKAETGAVFPVDPMIFRKINLPVTRALTMADEKSGTLFVLLFQEVRSGEKFPGVIVRINRGEAPAWNVPYAFDQLPEELIYSPDTQVLSVKTKNGQGEVFAINFDKTGKVVK